MRWTSLLFLLWYIKRERNERLISHLIFMKLKGTERVEDFAVKHKSLTFFLLLLIRLISWAIFQWAMKALRGISNRTEEVAEKMFRDQWSSRFFVSSQKSFSLSICFALELKYLIKKLNVVLWGVKGWTLYISNFWKLIFGFFTSFVQNCKNVDKLNSYCPTLAKYFRYTF